MDALRLQLNQRRKEEPEVPWSPMHEINALANEPAENWYNTGNGLLSLGISAEALVAFDKALTINPKYPDAWIGKGKALAAGGFQQYADKCYEYAKQLKGKN